MNTVTAKIVTRNAYVDTWRGIAILGVVCVHFGGSFATPTHAWTPVFYTGLSLNQAFSFAVPLFVFLSGLLSGWSSKRPSLLAYYAGRFYRIGLPYLVATVVAFFMMNHVNTWKQLPVEESRFSWLAFRVLWMGMEPTFYFIPLILQCYLLQPLLKTAPSWIERISRNRLSARTIVIALSLVFLVLHLQIGNMCYEGRLNFYIWGRPFAGFWMIYFFVGLHFRTLTASFSIRTWRILTGFGAVVATAAFLYSMAMLTDISRVGEDFSRSGADLAYVRPVIMVLDLAAVLAVASGMALKWSPAANILSRFGQASLSIYLWHIMLLYQIAWRQPDVMRTCAEVPELLVAFSFLACLIIGTIARQSSKLGARLFKRTPPHA